MVVRWSLEEHEQRKPGAPRGPGPVATQQTSRPSCLFSQPRPFQFKQAGTRRKASGRLDRTNQPTNPSLANPNPKPNCPAAGDRRRCHGSPALSPRPSTSPTIQAPTMTRTPPPPLPPPRASRRRRRRSPLTRCIRARRRASRRTSPSSPKP